MRTSSKSNATIQALAAIFRKGVKYYIRYPGNFVIYLFIPFLFSLMIFGMGQFVGGGQATANFAARTGTSNIIVYEILGSAVWMTSWVVVEDVGVALRDEQMKGTLEQNFLAPVNRFTLLVGMSLTDVVITTGIFFIVVGTTLAIALPSSFLSLIPAFLALLVGLIPTVRNRIPFRWIRDQIQRTLCLHPNGQSDLRNANRHLLSRSLPTLLGPVSFRNSTTDLRDR